MRTVVIPAAGLGSRLGDFTKNYSKAMCTLGSKSVFSYIIESFDIDDEIIVLLGYKGDYLEQSIKACYPDRNIQFVWVDNYQDEGSGLGYSLSCARELLQKPFFFWSCDTVLNSIYDPCSKFLGVMTNQMLKSLSFENMIMCSNYDQNRLYDYRHAYYTKDRVLISILQKGTEVKGYQIAPYIGLSFIKDFKEFWDAADSDYNTFVKAGESFAINNLKNVKVLKIEDLGFTWIDTGNRNIFEKAKKEFLMHQEETILEKPDETIWFIGNKVIKFHINPKFIEGRVERIDSLLNERQSERCSMPKLISSSANTYVYERADGEIMSKCVNPTLFKELLNEFIGNALFDKSLNRNVHNIYNDFYRKKTVDRIKKYLHDTEEVDEVCLINGLKCDPALKLVDKIDFVTLSENAFFTNHYHGDFHLENVLYDDKTGKFILLDWRQNFGSASEGEGDLYYDIAKMWHSLIVNHSKVKAGLFNVNVDKNENGIVASIDIDRTFIDTECEKVLIEFIDSHNELDINLSKVLTALIFLNIAACHTYPYSRFLYYLGRYLLQQCFNDGTFNKAMLISATN